MNSSRGQKIGVGLIVGFLMLFIGGYAGLKSQVQPTEKGEKFYYRVQQGQGFSDVIKALGEKKVVKNPTAFMVYAKMTGTHKMVRKGTYEVHPGMSFDEVISALGKPLTTKVRIPEGWWIARVAKLLEEKQVCSAEEYVKLSKTPQEFHSEFPEFEKLSSLEGYLYPDTYEFEPQMGAKAVILKQLANTRQKLKEFGKLSSDLEQEVIKASIIELEVSDPREQQLVSRVLMNRLERKMPLAIDATVLYALQKWMVLPPGVVRTVKSPYNTYLSPGLPPGPICSPTVAAIRAARNPLPTKAIFYVSTTGSKHLFAETYAQHQHNINVARRAIAQAAKKK